MIVIQALTILRIGLVVGCFGAAFSPRQKGVSISYSSNSLFEEPYWLDAVAPGNWKSVEVKKDEKVLGRLPFVLGREYGQEVITAPQLTPWLGPWVAPTSGKLCVRLGHESNVITKLIEQLPRTAGTTISAAPEIDNMLAFHWNRFLVELRYTYRLGNLSDLEGIWQGMIPSRRNIIRRAEKQVRVVEDLGLERFLDLVDLTFFRQGMDTPFPRELVRRIDDALSKREQRRLLFAVDDQNRVHAGIYVIWDERHAFYLLGGTDPEHRESGAPSLLIWHAIQHAATVTSVFDFEGSMIASIERFFRSFGAEQTPRYSASIRSRNLKLRRNVNRLFGPTGIRRRCKVLFPTKRFSVDS